MREKDTLRAAMRATLREIPLPEIAAASTRICQEIHRHPEIHHGAKTVTMFSARADEVNLSSLHQRLPDKQFLYPLCHRGGVLSFHHVESPAELTPGMLGILEPIPERHPAVATEAIDLFLCPGLIFGRDGSRLGHGGGFYDRALALRKPDAAVVGIGLQAQLQDSVPSSVHDVFMQKVVTENGLLDFKPH
ncbi:5-formyltetrahydrofolate cyclo-ligase [Verrucomicrobiaceae bacterium 5K15]|uniref:5-formyltetrahydrofolate cyclo-ligase n=1 Tax=Oceaniferula flava TaxID=2800421 RepID=A0AAE2SCR4_9BACT|nr:5-formyltetrahydrofolate cyclo-ligase [Oceaniferula flavus]MBK1854514.1 5-formyltetrahydrofolate cyclo-ligase [Oceaniferula flavus]MBM1135820.1 5-formyltetrahydrofolate cyclo-ligase [Oceaniferula flavus]